ncbi:hypothetical protein CSC81_07950 [Tenacibaculum discolor]|uniref:Uncharacterized protein n=1 Tax=Tenacibaculum discolor TaxID=361581 RepID=A0A2G1BTY3_9FLAO|nr:hypothetical protein [Tenacibaculum discolor]MDP2542077.1 hypothetical protein [Tenacibaculum discolor]PHN97512.1 hypothetical protein CSC81_07950 [Tenacibaculum discolor]
MNKKIIVTLLLSFFFVLKPFSQEKKIEEMYQKCLYNSLHDKGEKLKRINKEFENYLIKEKILKDSSGSSYKKFLNTLHTSKGKVMKFSFTYPYLDSMHGIENGKPIFFKLDSTCVKEIVLNDDFTKHLEKLESLMPKEKTNDLSLVFKNMDTVFSAEDFELDYYKQKFFILLCAYNELVFFEVEDIIKELKNH